MLKKNRFCIEILIERKKMNGEFSKSKINLYTLRRFISRATADKTRASSEVVDISHLFVTLTALLNIVDWCPPSFASHIKNVTIQYLS